MAIHIKQNGQFFEVSFDFDRKVVDAIKRIPGKRWVAAKKHWIVPTAEQDRLMRFYKKYSALATSQMPMEIGEIPELPYLRTIIPLKRPMFPFQERGVAYNMQHQRVLVGDKPGLGKTQQAIATIVAANAFPCFIVCPKTLRNTWRNEWDVVAGKRAMILDDRVKSNWWKYYERGMADIFIVNYESAERFFVDNITIPDGEKLLVKHIHLRDQAHLAKSVIIDEIHRCKEIDTRRAKLMIALTAGKEWVLGLTGTPVVNKTIDLLAQLCILGRIADFGGVKYFKERYCNNNIFLKELHYKLHTTCFYQRRKEEVLKDLPQKLRQKILVDITNRDEYNSAISSLADHLKQYHNRSEEQVRKSLQAEIMVRIGVCRAIAARGKLEAVYEQIDQLIEAGEKVVIFIHHRPVADKLMERYRGFVTVRGDDDADKRERSIQAFQNDSRIMGIICSTKAGGVGVTLTASRYVLLVELPWHAAECEQCEDRTHRIGQAFQVTAQYFIGHRTIDEDIYQLIEEKRELGDSITGGQDVTQEEIIDRISNSLFSGMTFRDNDLN